MTLPEERALHVERDELPIREPCVDHRAVADRTRERHVGLVMRRGNRSDGFGAVLPETFSTLAVVRLHEEHGLVRCVSCAARRAHAAFAESLRSRSLREPGALPAGRLAGLGRDDHHVADDDRGRDADAAEVRPPGDVLRCAPRQGQVALVRGARALRAAPLRPVGRQGDRNAKDKHHRHSQTTLHARPPGKPEYTGCYGNVGYGSAGARAMFPPMIA